MIPPYAKTGVIPVGCMLLGTVFAGGCWSPHSSPAPAGKSPTALDPKDAATVEALVRRAEQAVRDALKHDQAVAERVGAVSGITIGTIVVRPHATEGWGSAGPSPPGFDIAGTLNCERISLPAAINVSGARGPAGEPRVAFYPVDWQARPETSELRVSVEMVDSQLQFANP